MVAVQGSKPCNWCLQWTNPLDSETTVRSLHSTAILRTATGTTMALSTALNVDPIWSSLRFQTWSPHTCLWARSTFRESACIWGRWTR